MEHKFVVDYFNRINGTFSNNSIPQMNLRKIRLARIVQEDLVIQGRTQECLQHTRQSNFIVDLLYSGNVTLPNLAIADIPRPALVVECGLISLRDLFNTKITNFAPGIFQTNGSTFLHLLTITQVAASIAHAIDHIHRKGWVHAGVKPEAIEISGNGGIKLGGFQNAWQMPRFQQTSSPIATHLDNNVCHLFTDNNLYPAEFHSSNVTEGYTAPEVLLQHNSVCGKDVDWFSFGAILYECFTGKRPWLHNYDVIMYARGLCPLEFPSSYFTSVTAAAVAGLLVSPPNERLGAAGGLMHLSKEEFFKIALANVNRISPECAELADVLELKHVEGVAVTSKFK